MNVVFDGFWWWWDEFAGDSNAYITGEPKKRDEEDDVCVISSHVEDSFVDTEAPGKQLDTLQISPEPNAFDMSFLGSNGFPDWGWAASLQLPMDDLDANMFNDEQMIT